MQQSHVNHWVEVTPLTSIEVDCVTTVMLKILDGKCKMDKQEKEVMALLYHEVKHRPGSVLDANLHVLIAKADKGMDDELRELIYEKRVLAETMISRPTMKAFKSMLRQRGLFEEVAVEDL